MYLKNLLNITGRSPEKTSDLFVKCAILVDKKQTFAHQGSRYSVAAFLLLGLMLLPLVGCDSPAPVGNGLESDEESIITQVVDLENFSIIEANAYSGRLLNSAAGYVVDPEYGELWSASLLKPSIDKSQVDSIGDGDVLKLRLVFNEEVYGDESSTSVFEIFEVGEPWRGNELRYNQQVVIDQSLKVGEFEVLDQDTLEVDLSPEWREKYLEFYNASSADSLYRQDFRGLAIVPAEGNSKLHFLNHSPEEENNNPVRKTAVSLVVSSEENPGEEDRYFSMRDWGSSFIRENEPEYSEGLVLHSSERVLRLDLSPLEAELESNNVVSAELIFGVDTAHSNTSVTRPDADLMRGLVFSEEPPDLRAEMFLNSANFGGTLNEDENIFRIEITDYILNEIFGNREQGALYITLQESGIIYTTHLFDQNGPENMRPRLVITSVKSDS